MKIAEGDKQALGELFMSTKTAVYAFVLSLIKNREDAEDVFQEVYIKIFEKAYTYEQKGKPMAWIITIAKNLCYMRFRSQKDVLNIEDVDEIWTTIDNINDRLILEAAFVHLSEEERNIVISHVVSGLKHKEIATVLEMPLATVLSKYHRAMKKLRKALEAD